MPTNCNYIYIHYGLKVIIGSEIELPNDSKEMIDLQNMQTREDIINKGYLILLG